MSWSKALAMWALCGVAVACALLIVAHVVMLWSSGTRAGYYVNRIMRVLWPSSVWLMATEGIESTMLGYALVAVSIVANGVLYAIIGAGLCWCRNIRETTK